LGMIGPMILGVLKKQKSSLGLDAGGVANLLSQQKQNIASAMPSGLGNLLGSVPGIGSMLSGAMGSALGGASQTVGRATDAARTAVGAVERRASALPWVIGVAAVLLIGLFLWKTM